MLPSDHWHNWSQIGQKVAYFETNKTCGRLSRQTQGENGRDLLCIKMKGFFFQFILTPWLPKHIRVSNNVILKHVILYPVSIGIYHITCQYYQYQHYCRHPVSTTLYNCFQSYLEQITHTSLLFKCMLNNIEISVEFPGNREKKKKI